MIYHLQTPAPPAGDIALREALAAAEGLPGARAPRHTRAMETVLRSVFALAMAGVPHVRASIRKGVGRESVAVAIGGAPYGPCGVSGYLALRWGGEILFPIPCASIGDTALDEIRYAATLLRAPADAPHAMPGSWEAVPAVSLETDPAGLLVEVGPQGPAWWALVVRATLYPGACARIALGAAADLSGCTEKDLLKDPSLAWGPVRDDVVLYRRLLEAGENLGAEDYRSLQEGELLAYGARLLADPTLGTHPLLRGCLIPRDSARAARCDLCGRLYERASASRGRCCEGPSPDREGIPCCRRKGQLADTYDRKRLDKAHDRVRGWLSSGWEGCRVADRATLLAQAEAHLAEIEADSAAHRHGCHPATARRDEVSYLEDLARDLHMPE